MLIAQKINFISHFFLKTFFIFMQKVIFIPSLFLEILQRYCKLVVLGTLRTSVYVHQKQGNSDVYLQTKNQLDPSNFLEILHFKEFCNLFGQEHFGQ